MTHISPTNRTQDAIRLAFHVIRRKPRPRRDQHGAGTEARQAQGEALGVEKAERTSLDRSSSPRYFRVPYTNPHTARFWAAALTDVVLFAIYRLNRSSEYVSAKTLSGAMLRFLPFRTRPYRNSTRLPIV